MDQDWVGSDKRILICEILIPGRLVPYLITAFIHTIILRVITKTRSQNKETDQTISAEACDYNNVNPINWCVWESIKLSHAKQDNNIMLVMKRWLTSLAEKHKLI